MATFTVFAWTGAFASRFAGGLFIAMSALAIAVFAATEPRLLARARTATLTSLAWWLLLVLIASIVTLTKSGRFDEGGPLGLALVLGVYVGLPIIVLAVMSAELLGRLFRDEH
ncbi:hypothetical protein P7B02_06590 [Caulobacter segnis]|uniref:hypothetical protein n=1 Tax=Caulobacter segnis TaxID=88688 RepID=UPI00240EEE26|nr:hypothetical protein [Caulobacter segnis]MDG2521205.1 hypothetical protein [Caulobacter segnis]